ncbi:MAG TPA: histidine--tRNA ligase [Thermoanaerobaculia bacterium]|nr:histidine--tRNA ligase [Thermoanaerobaculia bacterium]
MASGSYRARSVKGMRDLLPPETEVWARVEATARAIFARYGFAEIRTPVVEETELFVRGIGEATDIVGKEMYTFADKRGKSLSLRPESTAPVARAFAEHGMREWPQPVRLFYIGPQFRYERPQRGRYRQFWQIGAELLGDPGPWSDVEVVLLLMSFLEELGFRGLKALVNTVGDAESRERYQERLRAYLLPRAAELGEDSRRRLDSNPLRILDTKSPSELELLAGAPRLEDSLSEASAAHFRDLLGALRSCGVDVEVAQRLVRGLDYYTHTVFEIVSPELGAQNAIVGGGRYDQLVEEVGGPPTPAIGFAIGLDRLIEILPAETQEGAGREPLFYAVAAGETPTLELLRLAEEMRGQGLRVVPELGGASMRAALRRADKLGVDYVAFLGDRELERGDVTIKDFRTADQVSIARGPTLAAEIRRWRERDAGAGVPPEQRPTARGTT